MFECDKPSVVSGEVFSIRRARVYCALDRLCDLSERRQGTSLLFECAYAGCNVEAVNITDNITEILVGRSCEDLEISLGDDVIDMARDLDLLFPYKPR
ncbi:MAG: hypothetical protein JWN75_1283 [Candidatus Saccharibacteria bacterium]|nr:hypothetical protein [Candidatus Saccharibacteria bacterium]